jgi:putative spermidine/putrescine transport system ATP-binding protein
MTAEPTTAEVTAPAQHGPAQIELRGIRKTFGSVVAVDNLDLDVRDGEFFAMLGPSGSGKTTVLRIIAGFETPTAGTVRLGGLDATRIPPFRRDVNTVFQDYALFPHMNVEDNVGYGLRVRRVPRHERARRVGEALELVRLAGYGGRRPNELSGGQRQRVAVARALVTAPALLLADEPTGNLDSHSTEEVLGIIDRLNARGRTVVVITHEDEVARHAKRVVRLVDGAIVSDVRQAPVDAPPPALAAGVPA